MPANSLPRRAITAYNKLESPQRNVCTDGIFRLPLSRFDVRFFSFILSLRFNCLSLFETAIAAGARLVRVHAKGETSRHFEA